MTQDGSGTYDSTTASGGSGFELSRLVARYLDAIRFGIFVALAFVVFGVVSFILFLDYTPVKIWPDAVIAAFLFAVTVVAGLTLIFLGDLLRARRVLQDWEERFREYALFTVFEFLERTDQDVRKDIINRLTVANPVLQQNLAEKAIEVKLSENVRGRASNHIFDIVIGGKLGELWLIHLLKDSQELSVSQLESLEGEVTDIALRKKHHRIELLVIGESEFSEEVIERSRDHDKWSKLKQVKVQEILLRTVPSGFYLASVSTPPSNRAQTS